MSRTKISTRTFPLSTHLERLAIFYGKYGLYGTLKRFAEIPARLTIQNRNVCFYVDLNSIPEDAGHLENDFQIEKKTRWDELSELELLRLSELRGVGLIRNAFLNMQPEKASLWLLKTGGMIVSTCWSVVGYKRASLPLPLGDKDVHIFDVETFPECKGKGLAPVLIGRVLERCKAIGLSRAYIDVKVWNKSSLAFVRKTCFKELGTVRFFRFFGKKVCIWR